MSPWNFRPSAASNARQLIIHDVTLRDGEQQAGVIFTAKEKIEIAAALDRMGVNRIEAGMVAVSAEDREAIRAIVSSKPRAEIWTIARSVPKDIELALECGVDGVGVILLGNEQYCRIFSWELEEVVTKALSAADRAKQAGLKTTLLIADSTRMKEERLKFIVESATKSNNFTALALMDTFGALSPVGTRTMIQAVQSMTDLPLEFHAHNDFGVGTANALTALATDVNILHTSVIGLGERIGNAPFEEVVLAAKLLYGAETNVDLQQLNNIASLVSKRSGVQLSPHKPVVGKNFTRIESGTVASEFLRWSKWGEDLQWIFPYVPSLVGSAPVELVLCKGSGLANIDSALEKIGLQISDDLKKEIVSSVKSEASRLHRELTLKEFANLVTRTTEQTNGSQDNTAKSA